MSLDEGDNDPTRFWSYVIAALPSELVRSHVEISIWQGWVLFVSVNYDEAERHLQDIAHTFDINDASAERSKQHTDISENINKAELFGRLTAIRASIAIIRGDLPRTIELSH